MTDSWLSLEQLFGVCVSRGATVNISQVKYTYTIGFESIKSLQTYIPFLVENACSFLFPGLEIVLGGILALTFNFPCGIFVVLPLDDVRNSRPL